jgi:hypothetical protein
MAGTRGRLSFEKFIFLYIAFDSCFAVHSRINGRDPRRTPHGDRIQQLCTTYLNNGIAPNWASASRPFAALRNDSFHEGIFFDEPLGFAPFGSVDIPKNVLMEMTALLSRLLIAIVGIPAKDYLRSPVDTRQRQLIQL